MITFFALIVAILSGYGAYKLCKDLGHLAKLGVEHMQKKREVKKGIKELEDHINK